MADMDSALGTAALLNGGLGGTNSWIWILLFFGFFLFNGGGFLGNNANGGYATSSELQRGFDNQNTMANQREILSAVNAGTAQSVATTNQVYHDIVGYVGDKYAELDRDVLGVSASVQQAIANQNQCCCDTKMLIQETAAQNRYDSAMNTQKILDVLAQNKIDSLQQQINSLTMANQLSGVVKYPTSTTYNAGYPPFPPNVAPFTPFA